MQGNAGTEEAKFRKGFWSVSFEMGAIGTFYQPRQENENFKKSATSCCVHPSPASYVGFTRGPGLGVRGAPKKYLTSEEPARQSSRQGSQRGGAGGQGQRLLGFIYLGGWRRGGLAVGGLRAKASSFGDGGGRGWVLGRSWGADYDRGGHGQVGALRGEGLLAPLLKWAAHTGSPGCHADLQPLPPRPH